ncbi:MAG: hypothetical protein KGP14_00055 [Betaproteobacteria bacterium]|nr:hypothetical protein [Betaproteobacteria bacterium]
MPTWTLHDAVGAPLVEEMPRDDWVIAFGEGIATKHQELVREFGARHIRNTPLAEGIIAGVGMCPVVDLLFAPFLCNAMDELVNSAGKPRFISGGQFSFPLVTLAMTDAGRGVGAEIAAQDAEETFAALKAPVVRLGSPDAPVAASYLLEQASVPQAAATADAARRSCLPRVA